MARRSTAPSVPAASNGSTAPRRSRRSLAADRYFKITRSGYLFLMLTAFMGLAAANTQVNLLFAVFGLMVGIALVAYTLGWFIPRGLRVSRVLPEGATVGQPTTLTYQIRNTKRLMPSLAVNVRELEGAEAFVRPPLAYLTYVGAGRTGTQAIEVIPKRRGLHVLDRYQLVSSFPFGFVRRALVRREHETLLVYPATGEVSPALLALCKSAETTGESMRPREGGMDEFYGVKEYRPGDNPRQIYWRRSARTGTLVSKEMTQVAPPRLLVLVDTHNPDRTAERYVAVEKAIAQAASILNQALETGLSVGVVAWTGEWLTVHPSRGKRHRRDVLAALALLPLNLEHDTDELLAVAQPLIKSGTTPIVLTGRPMDRDWMQDRRVGLITISSTSRQADAWFTFPATVDFARCMPLFRYQEELLRQPVVPRPPDRTAAA